jgi:hypothetical protein
MPELATFASLEGVFLNRFRLLGQIRAAIIGARLKSAPQTFSGTDFLCRKTWV